MTRKMIAPVMALTIALSATPKIEECTKAGW